MQGLWYIVAIGLLQRIAATPRCENKICNGFFGIYDLQCCKCAKGEYIWEYEDREFIEVFMRRNCAQCPSGKSTVSADEYIGTQAFDSPPQWSTTKWYAGTASEFVFYSTSCTPCHAGTFAPDPDSSDYDCTKCPRGKSTNGYTGSGMCYSCERHYYAELSGMATCTAVLRKADNRFGCYFSTQLQFVPVWYD